MDKDAEIKYLAGTIICSITNRSIHHLGKVKRMYQEATGGFSIYKRQQPMPGCLHCHVKIKIFINCSG